MSRYVFLIAVGSITFFFSFNLSSTEVAVLETTFIEPIKLNPEKMKKETDFEVETYARSSDCPFCQRITRLRLILHDILRAEKAACKCADNQCVCAPSASAAVKSWTARYPGDWLRETHSTQKFTPSTNM